MLFIHIIIQNTGAQVYQSLSRYEGKDSFLSLSSLSLFTFKYFVRTHISNSKHVLNGRRAVKKLEQKSTKGNTYDNISALTWNYHLLTTKNK